MRFILSSFFAILLGCRIATPARSDPPPSELLDAIFPVLRGTKTPRPSLKADFIGASTPFEPNCGLQPVDLIERRGDETHTFKLLAEPASQGDTQPTTMLIRLGRMTVNADGSRRAYHPDDPLGRGLCQMRPAGIAPEACDLDYLGNAEIHVWENAKKIPQFYPAEAGHPPDPNPAFATAWDSLWADIAARRDRWVDLGAVFGAKAPDTTRLYYSKETGRAVTFDTDIIPFKIDYPCQYSDDRHEYFVAATKAHPTPPPGQREDACSTAAYLDSAEIPFFVLPAGIFSHLTIGDVAIGFAKSGSSEQVVFGIIGDVGPPDQIGEGSIEFVRKLRNSPDAPKNSLDTGRLDITVDTKPGEINALSVLVLGGTAKALGLDYSRINIEKIAQNALRAWQRGKPNRLQACTDAAPPNPLDGFDGPPN